MKIAILVLLSFALVACVADPETAPDAGVETSPFFGDWSVMFDRTPCVLEGETPTLLVEFEIRRYAGIPMLSVTRPERDVITAGTQLGESDARVRWEDVTGALYDLTLTLDGETASAVVHYEHEHCAIDVDALSVKQGRL